MTDLDFLGEINATYNGTSDRVEVQLGAVGKPLGYRVLDAATTTYTVTAADFGVVLLTLATTQVTAILPTNTAVALNAGGTNAFYCMWWQHAAGKIVFNAPTAGSTTNVRIRSGATGTSGQYTMATTAKPLSTAVDVWSVWGDIA